MVTHERLYDKVLKHVAENLRRISESEGPVEEYMESAQIYVSSLKPEDLCSIIEDVLKASGHSSTV